MHRLQTLANNAALGNVSKPPRAYSTVCQLVVYKNDKNDKVRNS